MPKTLQPRELEILTGVAMGMGDCDIAQALKMSPSTVKAKLRRLKDTLGARDRTHMVVKAYYAGLMTLPDPGGRHEGSG